MPVVAGGLRAAAARGRRLRHAVDRVRPARLRRDVGRRRACACRAATRSPWPARCCGWSASRRRGRSWGWPRTTRSRRSRGRARPGRRTPCSRRPRCSRSSTVAHRSAAELAQLLPDAPARRRGHRRRHRRLGRRRARATVVERHDNPGFGAANNDGVARAAGDVTILLNPDIVATPAAIERLAMLAAGREALVVPRLLNADGSVQRSAFALPGRPSGPADGADPGPAARASPGARARRASSAGRSPPPSRRQPRCCAAWARSTRARSCSTRTWTSACAPARPGSRPCCTPRSS